MCRECWLEVWLSLAQREVEFLQAEGESSGRLAGSVLVTEGEEGGSVRHVSLRPLVCQDQKEEETLVSER